MQYNTQQFTSQIRGTIEKGDTGQALQILVNSLPEYNTFRNDFVSLLGEYEELKRYQLLGMVKDTERSQRIRFATLQFLQNLERHYNPSIELANAPYIPATQSKRKSASTNTKKRRAARAQKVLPIQALKKNVETHLNRLVWYGLAFVIIIGFIYIQYIKPFHNSSVQTQLMTSDDIEIKHIGLVVLLNQFERFEDADTERKENKKKNLSILQIKGDTKPFKTVIMAERNLDKVLYDVQKTWPQATINNYGLTCPTFKYEKSVSVYICNK